MIPITPDILGDGIEEEYADALQAIGDIRAALGPRPMTNTRPDGRLLLNLVWIEQEIVARRLPIPVDKSFVGNVFYLIASGELEGLPGLSGDVHGPLCRLSLVLDGTGLMKPRHLPVLVALMDDLLVDARRCPALSEAGRATLADLQACREELQRGGEWPTPRRPQDYPRATPDMRACIDNLGNRLFMINASLFEGWRPYPAKKPPLPAPVPGLPAKAPSLPAELEGKLP